VQCATLTPLTMLEMSTTCSTHTVAEEMPSWITDSQFQRVEWLNSLCQRLWPQISAACEPLVKESLQPTLDAQCPKILGALTLGKFSLGSISPKIVGVRFFEGTESHARMDLEIRWAGDPSVVLTVGSARVNTPIEVSDIRLSAIARVEFLDLQPTLPPFRALSVTFMKRPTLHFSLKVARLDIMNLGAADFNVTALVRTLLQRALSEALLYPKKMVIPMHSDANTDAYYAMHPVGILYVTFVKGTNLKQANVFGSDPYCIARSMQQEVRTAVKPYR
jgi:Ca2+-dependent lipid-binding protein